jgi:hypothetical protein
VLVALTASLAGACTPADEGEARGGCAATVREASLAAEVAEQVRLLDTALVACRSYDSLVAELARYPGIIGYDSATFVRRRCTRVDDDRIRSSPACQEVVAPTTTVPPATDVELVFVGETLDGRPVEIRPGPDTPFDGEVPAVVQQTVDIAIESGCPGLLAQRDLWLARIDDPGIGDVASVYAKHAENVAAYVQCDFEPAVPGG